MTRSDYPENGYQIISVVSPDVARSMLAIAARHGSAALFDKMLAAAKTEPDPYFRPMLIQTLGQFRNKNLIERSFQLAFDGHSIRGCHFVC